MATYTVDTMPSKLNAGDIINCDYSGSMKSCTLPKGEYKLECWGAEGGGSTYHGTTGGKGGYSAGTITITQPTIYYIYVGGAGKAGSYNVNGGWNGGGGITNSYNSGGSGDHIGTGGGATDISTVGGDCTVDSYMRYVRTSASYQGRIIVAGGGGGAEYGSGGAGGGTSGIGSYPGTQSAAGAASNNSEGYATMYDGGLGYGVSTTGGHTNHAMGACGGGGYYGGGARGENSSSANICGSGGSGFVSSILTDAQTIAGNTSFLSPTGAAETGHTGNGYVRITVIKVSEGVSLSTKLIGSWKSSSSVYAKTNDIWKKVKNMYVKKEPPLPTVTPHIYGAIWDGSSDPAWTRTDDSADFVDPVPAVNNGDGSSPFDECYPWSEIRRIEDHNAGTLVEIPKFWYKWTRDGASMKLQISNVQREGFYTSPAHADRGDGEGERNYVYVGAYHCATGTYRSTTGVKPQVSITRATARTDIHNLSETIWQYDFAMHWTIAMLYLVEFANWNSQEKIGYGCGNNSSAENSGLCDSMIYHTGTNVSSRTTYGHTRYRYIEDLWGNVLDWCDGIYFNSTNIYCIKNPSDFSDTSGGILTGTRPTSNGYISAWNVPTVSGFEYALHPSEVAGTDSTYIPDYCYNDSSGITFRIGGTFAQYQYRGIFSFFGNFDASTANTNTGSRLMKLPNYWKKVV